MSALIEFLNELPLAGLMLVVTLGYLLGRISVRGISIGPAGGTLIVAILLGHAGLGFEQLYGSDTPELTLGYFGFALFIYSVGFEAGPRFFTSLRGGEGWRAVVVGVTVNVVAVAATLLGARLVGLDGGTATGTLAGALTSAPTYAAAVAACDDLTALAVSFAVAYPFGLAGLVVLVQVLPRLTGVDLAEGTTSDEDDDDEQVARSPELTRAFNVENAEVIGATLADLALSRRSGCYLSRVHRGSRILIPDAETCLERDDHVMARGRLEELRELEKLIGPEVYDSEMRDRLASPRSVHVSAPDVSGRTLRELNLVGRHHCLVTEVIRNRVRIEPSADLRLLRDDVVRISGERENVRAVARVLGRFERSTNETDIAVYAGGILAGLLIGSVRIGGVSLGTAGGLLLAGVLLGRFRRIGPISAHVPAPARQLVRDLGSLLFIAETGVFAGQRLLESDRLPVLRVLGVGACIALAAVLGALFVGRVLLKMRPADLWGAICGGMTSAAALGVLRRAADSNEPAVSYATSYAVASVLATMAGPLVLYLLR